MCVVPTSALPDPYGRVADRSTMHGTRCMCLWQIRHIAREPAANACFEPFSNRSPDARTGVTVALIPLPLSPCRRYLTLSSVLDPHLVLDHPVARRVSSKH
ncbi:unnamed protein product [Ectocarpus sp. 4 AP-2014]